MPAQRGFTANFVAVQAIADQALDHLPEGISLTFLVSEGYTYEDCKSRARSLQQSFAALRARERRLSSQRAKGEYNARDLVSLGRYDKLACFREVLPDEQGARLVFTSAQSLLDGLVITDNKTGKPLDDLGREADERHKLIQKAVRDWKNFTTQDWDRLTELDLEAFPEGPAWHSLEGECAFPRPIPPTSEQWGTVKDADLDALRESGDIFGEEG